MTGPPIDYERLRGILASPAGATMPEALKARMTADIAQHDMEQGMSARQDATFVTNPVVQAEQHARGVQTAQHENDSIGGVMANLLVKQPTMFAMQVAHDMTLGISPKVYGNDPALEDSITSAMEIPIRMVSGIGTMVFQGAGLLRGLSYVGKVPIAARALEFIPGRLKEIGVGALVNGGIDALRADGLDREPNGAINDPSWLDPSAKIAKPLAEIGIPDRVALGLGGAVVGGLVGSVLIGVAKGWQKGREGMSSLLDPKVSEAAREGLVRAGVDMGMEGDKYLVAKTFIKNFRKVALNEDLAAPMADQLSREAYISSEIASGSANSASPERITAAAMEFNGRYFQGYEHGLATADARAAGVVSPGTHNIGFMTSRGRFVEDPEALTIGKASGQLDPNLPVENISSQTFHAKDPSFGTTTDPKLGLRSMVSGEVFPKTGLPTPEEIEQQSRLMAGIFRQNPGGVNIVTNLTSDEAVQAAQSRLGVKLAVAKIEQVPAGTKVYHGTPTPLTELPSAAGGRIGGVSYAEDPSIAKGYAGPKGQVVEGYLDPKAKIIDATGTMVNDQWHQIPQDEWERLFDAAQQKKIQLAPNYMPTREKALTWEAVMDNDNPFQDQKLGGLLKSLGYQAVRHHDDATRIGSDLAKRGLPAANLGKFGENVPILTVLDPAAVNKTGFGTKTFDLLIGRPVYDYPSFADQTVFGRLTNKVTGVLKKMATEAATSVRAPRTTEAFILADGEPIRGGLNTTAMIEKMRLQKPIVGGVERGDIGLREAGKFVRLELTDVDKLTIDLPRQLSKEQFVSIGKAIDTMKFSEVTINLGEKSMVVKTPIGAVVQDHIASMVPPKSVGSSITPEMVKQYKKSGVFAGQAAVLPDGTGAEIVHKHGAAGYKVRETLTGKEFIIGGKNLTILPTALQGEFQGSNLFASHMSDVERAALAKLRKAQLEGWAEPIKKYRDFESYANTRGYMAEQLRAGKVRLSKVNEGGHSPILFKDIPSAIEWIRKDTAPMAELANDEVTKLLGPDRNIGWIGGGGPPPRFNEVMPIDWKRMEATMETLSADRGPGFFENALKPMMPYLRDLDQRFGTQMYKAAYNMQTQGVARDNFLNLWYHGKGGELPSGVKPLKQIIHEAGPNVDRELIGNWLEVKKGTIDEVDLLKSMNSKEKTAATELRAWFTSAYPALGIDAPFVEEYMPRYREAVQSGDAKTFQEFMSSIVNDPLKVPKGTDFVSDHIREGLIDTYEKDAFKVAVQYLRAGAKNRYMKQAQDEAREMVRMVSDKNPQLALPLGNMLQAMGGFEFTEQRAMIKESFLGLLERIPGGVNKMGANQDLAERFTNWSTSLVYASTMGFRPSLALRNAKDIYVMAYPLYSGPRFNEAIGRALTTGGKQEAMAARAISEYAGGMLTAETQEIMEKLPEWAKNLQHASTFLYDSADNFTRAGTYFAAKFKAEDALASFAKRVEGIKNPKLLKDAKDQLIRDSKVYFHGDEVVEEFLRRAANSPDKASEYAGKIASDMTNFLYGRGMQSRWMRSIGGRLMGQFGSWSMWYADYLTRMVRAVGRPEYRADALAALGRHALVNAAILSTGKFLLGVDLSRWASYGALFYSGGPGWQVAVGASTLMRGLGDASSAGEDPLAQSRISQGSQMIWNTLPAFVPFLSAGRDVYRMSTPFDQTDFLAATLGTRTTKDYQARRKVDILLGDYSEPFQSTSPMLHRQLNSQATGQGQQPVDMRMLPPGGVQTTGVTSPNVPEPPSQSGSKVQVDTKNLGGLPTTTPAGSRSNLVNEVKSTIEPKPSRGY